MTFASTLRNRATLKAVGSQRPSKRATGKPCFLLSVVFIFLSIFRSAEKTWLFFLCKMLSGISCTPPSTTAERMHSGVLHIRCTISDDPPGVPFPARFLFLRVYREVDSAPRHCQAFGSLSCHILCKGGKSWENNYSFVFLTKTANSAQCTHKHR